MGANLYETDFYGWTQWQSELLKAGRLAELDTENLIEEIEAMGRGERQQLAIIEQRRRIAKLLAANLSLKPVLNDCFVDAYDEARFSAMKETGLPLDTFPEQLPFEISKVLDIDFMPD